MAKLIIFCAIFAVSLAIIECLDVGCPLSSQTTSCTPKCKNDSECFGKKCCPNICNSKSCVDISSSSKTKDGYKNQNTKSATGSYCGNVKCNSYEKCELERSTKRQKCVRA